jgi:hypothetical protein
LNGKLESAGCKLFRTCRMSSKRFQPRLNSPRS